MIYKQTFAIFTVLNTIGAKNFTNNPTVHGFCHNISCKEGYLRYCNITSSWEPRISEFHSLTAFIVVTVGSFITTFVGILVVYKKLIKLHKREGDNCRSYVCVVVLTIGTLIWDAIDASLDAYTFHQLEQGKLIDPVIHRNSHVTNGIMVFACLGVLKMVITFTVWYKVLEEDSTKSRELRTVQFLITFLFEDCAEIFLEYFWIEKYFTLRPSVYLIVKDVMIACLACYTAIYHISTGVKELFERHDQLSFVFSVSLGMIVSIVEFLRVGGAVYQYVTGKLNSDCFGEVNGKLIQFPLTSGCLREVDYAILALIFIPWFVVFVTCGVIILRSITGRLKGQ